jgi:response regulator NasT
MGRTLLICTTQKGGDFLREVTKGFSLSTYLELAHSGGEARRSLALSEYDLVIINAPLSDEFGHEVATKAVNTNTQVILIAKSELIDDVNLRVEGSGVIVMEKPLNRAFFSQAMRICDSAYLRIQLLKEENEKLQKKIEEIRLVDRAKYLLIEVMGMTEAKAHRYIEKQAMDRRMQRVEVARGILKAQSFESESDS